jgi:hypothetical protein
MRKPWQKLQIGQGSLQSVPLYITSKLFDYGAKQCFKSTFIQLSIITYLYKKRKLLEIALH